MDANEEGRNVTNINGTGLTLVSNHRCFYLDSLNEYNQLHVIESIITLAINLVCSLIATVGNGIIIVTFWKASHLRSPSHLFLWCLAMADFITGLIVQPCYAAYKITYMLGHGSALTCIPRIIMETVAWFSAALSCTTFASITGERYLALYYHLRYQELVTSRKITTFIVYLWISTAVLSLSRFAVTNFQPFLFVNIFGLLCSLLTLLISYWKILQLVRHHHRCIQDQAIASPGNNNVDLKQFKKSAFNIAFIAVLYMIAYFPFTCVLVAYLQCGFTKEIEAAYDVTRTLAFMTSSWNPFLYCWKMADVRCTVKNLLRKESKTSATNVMELTTSGYGRH